jgi:hypothetical protein
LPRSSVDWETVSKLYLKRYPAFLTLVEEAIEHIGSGRIALPQLSSSAEAIIAVPQRYLIRVCALRNRIAHPGDAAVTYTGIGDNCTVVSGAQFRPLLIQPLLSIRLPNYSFGWRAGYLLCCKPSLD